MATPEYNGGAPGQLKNALDWASRPYGLAAVVGKPAGVISASTGSFGGRWAQEDVRKALRLSGAAVLGEGLAVGKAAERLAELGEADEEIVAGIDDVLAQLRRGRRAVRAQRLHACDASGADPDAGPSATSAARPPRALSG